MPFNKHTPSPVQSNHTAQRERINYRCTLNYFHYLACSVNRTETGVMDGKGFCWTPSFTLSHPFPILHIPFHSLTSLCFSFQCKHSSLTRFHYESSNRICLTLTKVVNRRLNEYSTEILNVSQATTRQSATVWYGINRRELIVVQRRFKKYNHESTKTRALKRSGWY